MPMYDFKCGKCEHIKSNVLLRITHAKDDLPVHCGQPMGYHITQPPLVHWVDPVIEPFRSVATKDKPVITNTRERREYMKRNDLVDANDLKPPTVEEEQQIRAKVKESIDKISPTAEQHAKLERQGLLNPEFQPQGE